LSGDVVLADRGFTCEDYVGLVMARIKTPLFTRGKNQLEKVDVDWSIENSHQFVYTWNELLVF
jgi:hypothetical protein